MMHKIGKREYEVSHSIGRIFDMGSPYWKGNVSYAYLSEAFDAPEGEIDRNKILTGEQWPKIKELEIFKLK